MKTTKQLLLGSVAAGALLMSAQDANAVLFTFGQLIQQGPAFRLEDDNGEAIIDRFSDDVGTPGANAGILNVGDSLRGVANWISFVSTPTGTVPLDGLVGGAESHGPQMSTIFMAKVLTKTLVAGTRFDFTFGADPDLKTDYPGLPTGTMIAIYEGAAPDLVSCTIGFGGTCESTASSGTLVLALGLKPVGSDPDSVWFAPNSEEDTSLAGNLEDTEALGSFTFALDILFSSVGGFEQINRPVGLPPGGVGADGKVDMRGSGNILGTLDTAGNPVTNYDVTSDAQVSFLAVPEPTTLTLFGVGLLGLGAFARRRNNG